MIIQEFSNDQRREYVNTQQRFDGWNDARERLQATRGSIVWHFIKGTEYLVRSSYEKSGVRKQRSLGKRSAETEYAKAEFERRRNEAKRRFKEIDATLQRQVAINRAVGLGRVPLISARIIRALGETGSLGAGIRVVGTNAIYAYEAVAGVMVDPGLTTTGDIDLLFDSRGGLRFVVSPEISERSLLKVLQSVDKTFERTKNTFRAQNSEGFMVDLIKPMRNPPWREKTNQPASIGSDDLVAAEIEGLVWLENAPPFEALAIDERGFPLRIVAADPRAWAVHKHWLSQRADREPIKRRRDAEQAVLVGGLVRDYFPHLRFDADDLKMLPKELVRDAAPLFAPPIDPPRARP